MSSNMIKETDGIISFELFKIERGREKLCQCNPPHYIIDPVNRIVVCDDCGATIDPFDALKRIYEEMERLEHYQKEAMDKIEAYRERANKEFNRVIREKVFKDMDREYHKGMYPVCPKCHEQINPVDIKEFRNKKFYKEN